MISKILADSQEWLSTGVMSLSLTELKKLKEDPEYQEDATMTSSLYVRFCKLKDGIEDQTLFTANENIKDAEDLEGDLQVYNETVHPLYEEQRDKAKELAAIVQEK